MTAAGVRVISQGMTPRTQSELYTSFVIGAVILVAVVWSTYRRLAPQRRALKEAAADAAAHWDLQRSTADRCVLTNMGQQAAQGVTLAIRPHGQHAPLALWVDMFGLHAMGERLRRRHPDRRAQLLHPSQAALVPSGSSIELPLRSNAESGWLEVEWRQPNGTSNWTKYVIPDNIDPSTTTG